MREKNAFTFFSIFFDLFPFVMTIPFFAQNFKSPRPSIRISGIVTLRSRNSIFFLLFYILHDNTLLYPKFQVSKTFHTDFRKSDLGIQKILEKIITMNSVYVKTPKSKFSSGSDEKNIPLNIVVILLNYKRVEQFSFS